MANFCFPNYFSKSEAETTDDWIRSFSFERKQLIRTLLLSLSNTIPELESFGVKRSRKAANDWVQKADLRPAGNASRDQISVDETVIRINGQQFWLYAAVNPETNEILYLWLFTTTTTALTQQFLRELREKHDVENVLRTRRKASRQRRVSR